MHFLGIVTTRHLLSPECPDRGQGGQIPPSPWSHKGRAQPLKTMGEHQVPCARQHSTATRAELQGPSSGTHRVLWHALGLHADGPCEHTDRPNSCPFTLVMFPQIQGSQSFRPRLALRDPGCAQELTCTPGPPPPVEAWVQPAPPVSSGHAQVTDKAGAGPLSTLARETICCSPRGPGATQDRPSGVGELAHAGRAAGEAGWGGAQQKISSPSADASDTGPSPG